MAAQQPSPEQKRKSAIRAYAKYGGMAFQFLGASLVGVFLGKWIDAKMGWSRPVGAVFLPIGLMVASFMVIYRQLMQKDQ